MNNYKIKKATAEVFKECGIDSFPINCEKILNHYGYRIYKYNELIEKSPELYRLCVEFSDDAFHDRGSMIIAYNADKPNGRIRFSLMHELGHHMLNHKSDSRQNEQEANAFASNILAPRIAIYYAECKNAVDVSKIFGLTNEASQYAFDDFRRWRRQTFAHKQSLTSGEWEIYRHFYNVQKRQFIWNKKKCIKCRRFFYNSKDILCEKCIQDENKSTLSCMPFPVFNESVNLYDNDFRRAENYYLYRDDL